MIGPKNELYTRMCFCSDAIKKHAAAVISRGEKPFWLPISSPKGPATDAHKKAVISAEVEAASVTLNTINQIELRDVEQKLASVDFENHGRLELTEETILSWARRKNLTITESIALSLGMPISATRSKALSLLLLKRSSEHVRHGFEATPWLLDFAERLDRVEEWEGTSFTSTASLNAPVTTLTLIRRLDRLSFKMPSGLLAAFEKVYKNAGTTPDPIEEISADQSARIPNDYESSKLGGGTDGKSGPEQLGTEPYHLSEDGKPLHHATKKVLLRMIYVLTREGKYKFAYEKQNNSVAIKIEDAAAKLGIKVNYRTIQDMLVQAEKLGDDDRAS